MSWGSDLVNGFNASSGAINTYKDRKQRKQERAEDIEIQKAREVIDAQFRDTELTNRGIESAARLALDGDRVRMDAQRLNYDKERDARDFAFRRDQAANIGLDRMSDRGRQAIADFSTEIDKAKTDPFREKILLEQGRELELRNNALANPQPRPTQPMETVEFDPESGMPTSRRITGPAGGLGAFTDTPADTDAAPSFSKGYEGREVTGPDGKRYIIKNGTPVLK